MYDPAEPLTHSLKMTVLLRPSEMVARVAGEPRSAGASDVCALLFPNR